MVAGQRYIFGRWEDGGLPLDRAKVAAICEEAEHRRDVIAKYPLHKVLALLSRAQKVWADPAYTHRQKMVAVLPDELGFSQAMVQLGLQRVAAILDPSILVKKVESELAGIPRSVGYKFVAETCTAMRWYPLGILLHVLAGNGFLGAISSLLEGLLTGNVNLLKMASGRTSFLPTFLQSLQELDKEGVITGSIAAFDYTSDNEVVIEELKRRVDGIVVWGGEHAVRGYRDGLPARTRIIVFGPKMSLGLVTRGGLKALGVSKVAEKLAQEISIWDQTACTAPQLCYVEGEREAYELARELAKAMNEQGRILPAGHVDQDAAVEIRKHRGLALLDEARGKGLLCESPKGLDWTVYVSQALTPEPSPLHRTLRLVPYSELKQVTHELCSLRGYVQTVGVVTALVEQTAVCSALAEAGALRMLDLGKMSYGEVTDPHDGAYDLPQLMYLVFNRITSPTPGHALIDLLPAEERQQIINERIGELSYQQEYYPALRHVFAGHVCDNTAALSQLPVMKRANPGDVLPDAEDLVGGYVSRSGGTTGSPRFSVYDGRDWEAMIDRSLDVLRAVGLRRGDRVANCLAAGDLYGSFVSFDHINSRIGAATFGFAATKNIEAFVHAWRQFRFNVVQGMPTHVIPLLQEAKKVESGFSIEKFIYGGMRLSAADREWLKSELGVERIAAILGANDGGPVGFQCEALGGDIYHVLDDYNYVEVVDSSGAAVKDGEAGRILITSLCKFASPLIRYEIGDLGRIVPSLCSCRRTGRLLEYRGRIEDEFTWHGVRFTHHDICEALASLPASQIQVVIENSEQIAINLEGEGFTQGKTRSEAEALVKKLMKDRGIAKGLIPSIEVFELGGIPRNMGSVKVSSVKRGKQGS